MKDNLNIIISVFCVFNLVKAFNVEIRSSGSAVLGATINFTATLYDGGQIAPNGKYTYNWQDNAKPVHSTALQSELPYSNWSIEYKRGTKTQPGKYRVTLSVDKSYIGIWIPIATGHTNFELNDSLIGKMQLIQNGLAREKEFVATKVPVNHTISLKQTDADFLQRNATSVQTFWFRNCTFLGVSDSLNYEAVYEKEDEIYEIEVLVVASFEKLPEPTTTTTTTSTTTTTTTTTTAATTTTSSTTSTTTAGPPPLLMVSSGAVPITTIEPSTTSIPALRVSRSKRNYGDDKEASELALSRSVIANAALLGLNVTTAKEAPSVTTSKTQKSTVKEITHFLYSEAGQEPPAAFNCVDKSIVAKDNKKVYGYFRHRVVSKTPISNFTTTGKNWLQHGDILRLLIKCKGSASLEYCTSIYNAPYNATGNETCRTYYSLDQCQLNFNRYFSDSKTVLFFIRNDVSSTMNQVTINIYEVKKQSQLSVVVVPVSFTLVAVILIVFGVSYYIQSQNRFTVEVADFNFGDTQSLDMEYKTFHQRLIDSIRDVFPIHRRFSNSSSDLAPEPGSSIGGSVDSNLRYNNMSS